MAIMSYQPLDEQLSTQFLNLLGDGGMDPLRPPGAGLAGVWQTPSLACPVASSACGTAPCCGMAFSS